MRVFILSLGLAWSLAGCKSSSSFSGGTKQSTGSDATVEKTGSGTKTRTATATGTSTSKDVGANEWATLTDATTDTATSTGEKPTHPVNSQPTTLPASQGQAGEIDGHPVGTTCDQCYQLALREAQKAGFTASKQFIHNYGPGKFLEAPKLCDIHWRNPNGPQEVFTACDCNCVNP